MMFLLVIVTNNNAQLKTGGYPISPVPFTSVKVTDTFWGQRLKANREVTIPLAFHKCEETGRYKNFEKAAHPSPDYIFKDLLFDDTDVYKTIEGASYSIQTYPDKKLEKYMDSILNIVAAAQEPDGYLFTARTMNPQHYNYWAGRNRWDMEEAGSHELYNLGHLIEAAVAHYQATGKRTFLDIAIRFADCAERELGDAPGKRIVTPGHQITEMALARLYLVTGQKKYLDLAKFFLDKRGENARNAGKASNLHKSFEYDQTHKPVIAQDEAVGHAVRAVYMYSGMADVAALTGDSSYIRAIDKIWENTISKKLYVTGGIGSVRPGEAFGANYDLPNLTAYCETCAAIANVYWNYRLFLLHGDAKYYDVLERTLYNALIAGVSLDGGTFFYPNPLESDGVFQFNEDKTLERQPWFGCACCPSNISRFIPSLPGYVYAVNKNDVYVNLFMGNTSELMIGGKKLSLSQTTGYPWNGDIRLLVNPHSRQHIALKVRIPGWVRNEVVPSDLYTFADDQSTGYSVKVNGETVNSTLEKGYFVISRIWKKGDVVDINFEMKPRMVKAHAKVQADQGRVSFERGPIVYCAEWPDNACKIPSILLPTCPAVEVLDNPALLGGIKQLKTQAQSLQLDTEGRLRAKDITLTLTPYYAWCHRGSGGMAVWLAQDVSVVRPEESGE